MLNTYKGGKLMNFKESPDRLKTPEFYMEKEGYDIRLATLKINDFLDTLGDATTSIIYSDKNEHPNTFGRELSIIRRIHMRHAIMDLNNCYDLLLQIPWFYYRIWQDYNQGGTFCNKKFQYVINGENKERRFRLNITRNVDGWVEKVEKECDYPKVLQMLENQTDQDIIQFKSSLKNFTNNYVFNFGKKVSIRSIANQIKHNGSLKVKELYEPYEFNVSTSSGQTINLKDSGLGAKLNAKFYQEDNPQVEIGELQIAYTDDLYIDISYPTGEKFRAKDYIKSESLYSLDDIYDELVNYRESLIDLYNDLFILIDSNLDFNPLLPEREAKKISTINLDTYFKQMENNI